MGVVVSMARQPDDYQFACAFSAGIKCLHCRVLLAAVSVRLLYVLAREMLDPSSSR